MLKRILTFMMALTVFAFVSCGDENSNTQNDSTADVSDTVKAETSAEAVSLDEFDAKASDLVDKEIELTGIVDHVCKHGGKRLFLVSDGGNLHVDADVRFDDALAGSEIVVRGIVREERVDEAYLVKWEEDETNKHSEGDDNEERMAQVKEQIKYYRDSMSTAGVDHLSFYSLEYVSHEAKN